MSLARRHGSTAPPEPTLAELRRAQAQRLRRARTYCLRNGVDIAGIADVRTRNQKRRAREQAGLASSVLVRGAPALPPANVPPAWHCERDAD